MCIHLCRLHGPRLNQLHSMHGTARASHQRARGMRYHMQCGHVCRCQRRLCPMQCNLRRLHVGNGLHLLSDRARPHPQRHMCRVFGGLPGRLLRDSKRSMRALHIALRLLHVSLGVCVHRLRWQVFAREWAVRGQLRAGLLSRQPRGLRPVRQCVCGLRRADCRQLHGLCRPLFASGHLCCSVQQWIYNSRLFLLRDLQQLASGVHRL